MCAFIIGFQLIITVEVIGGGISFFKGAIITLLNVIGFSLCIGLGQYVDGLLNEDVHALPKWMRK